MTKQEQVEQLVWRLISELPDWIDAENNNQLIEAAAKRAAELVDAGITAETY